MSCFLSLLWLISILCNTKLFNFCRWQNMYLFVWHKFKCSVSLRLILLFLFDRHFKLTSPPRQKYGGGWEVCGIKRLYGTYITHLFTTESELEHQMIERAAGVNSEQREDDGMVMTQIMKVRRQTWKEMALMTLKQKLMRPQNQRQRKKTSMENLICKFLYTKYLKILVRSPLSKIILQIIIDWQLQGRVWDLNKNTLCFLSQLIVLFNFCRICKADNPSVEAREIGAKAIVTSTCCNPECPKPVNHWHSQPNIPYSGIAAGNFLLCMAILLAGGSASKVFKIFAHMGLGCVSLNTFFKCQRVS